MSEEKGRHGMTFEEYKEYIKTNGITITEKEFAEKCADVINNKLGELIKENPTLLLVITVFVAELNRELFQDESEVTE